MLGPIIGTVLALLIITLGALLGWVILPPVVDKQVAAKTRISECSDNYDRWVDIPQPLHMKVWFFNILNPDEVHSGAEYPKVEEVGPYVYKYQHSKKNIKFTVNKNSVEFDDQSEIIFDREATDSKLSDTDEIYVVNPLVVGVSQLAEIQGISSVIATAFNIIFNSPATAFIRTTPKEILFDGIRFCLNGGSGLFGTQACNKIKNEESKNIIADGNDLVFSFFGYKNRELDGVYEVHTGKANSKDTNVIKGKNGSPYLDIWGPRGEADKCNEIRGTDGLQFPPLREPEGFLTAYANDICSSVDIHYDEKVEYKDRKGYRFSPRSDFLENIGPEYGNECFCVNNPAHGEMIQENGCLYPGALDLTKCVSAPLILTNPHMYKAHEKYTTNIEGLNPDREKHYTFIDVEPYTGIPLRGGKRVQFNVLLRPVGLIKFFENYKPQLMPVFWLEEGIELNDEMLELLDDELYDTLKLLTIIVWVIVGAGLGIGIVMVAWLGYRIKAKRSSKGEF